MGTGYRYTIKTLWGLAKSKELGLTEEELHLLVARETGKDSIRELNRSELSHVCHILQKQKDDIKRQEGRLPERRGNPQTAAPKDRPAEGEAGLGGAAGPCPVPPDVPGGRSGMADLLPVPGID